MLVEKLKDYAKQDIYPFHMPGHKRRRMDEWNPYEIDITEIDGFDNLHHAEEMLKDVQQKAAKLYGAEQSFYLVNGSTCGILTAISACVKKRGHILVARNCHKSVYHALFLRELHPVYLYPQITSMGLQGQVTAEEVARLLQENSKIEAVCITSPTYDGIVSDVRAIAKIVHAYDIPLIVDAAHGAHFGFIEDFPENPVRLGADVVIESVHKTLPAFTQTALLHICSSRISIEQIKRYLGIYESSSPSYLLMAGIDRCMEYMKAQGRADLKQLVKHLDVFYKRAKDLKHLFVLQKDALSIEEAFDFDASKVLIFSRKKEVNGAKLHQILLEKYRLQMEMTSGQYVLALCSMMDTEEGFTRLAEALEEIDESDIWEDRADIHSIETDFNKICVTPASQDISFKSAKAHFGVIHVMQENITMEVSCEVEWHLGNIYRQQTQKLPIYATEDLEKKTICLLDASGRISGDYLFLYPPGIPFLVPGEVITDEVIGDIQSCQKEGLEVLGLVGNEKIVVVEYT